MFGKKFSVPALLVVFSMLLASCGGTAASPTATTAPAPVVEATATAAPAMEATATTAPVVEATATTAMAGSTPAAMMGPITVKLAAENGSGQDGTATITQKGDADVMVSVSLSGGGTDPQPAHIHKGSCAKLDPNPAFPLTNVVSGKSETEVMVPMSELAKGGYAINVHKSAAEAAVYVACGDIKAEGGTTGGGTSTGGEATDPSKVGKELADAYAGNLKGKKVTMFGPFGSEDEVKFNNAIKDFETKTGIDIQYEGSKEFETTINVRVEGGNPPDIADFPQPGLMASIAKAGKIQDVSKWVSADWLKANYNQGYLDTATVDGPSGKMLGGVFHRVNTKSLVWYPKKAFESAGYKIPTTWDEQKALMDQIVKDGDTPWCIGIESGTATGWAATDWMEDIMLRTTSPENYDKWTRGELPFTSPEVKKAAQLMSDIWFNDKYVYGGRKQIVSTSFGDAPAPMFQDPPKCYLHRQGNFITSFFEKSKPGVKGGVDYDFYYLPPIDQQYGKPVLFAGDLMTAFTDRPEVRAVEEYFTTYESVKGWVAAGGALSPHKNSNLADYGTDTDRKVAQTLLNATVVRFDGSDLMPGAVGAGTFWKGMTDYVSGSVNLDQAMEEIQKGWSAVKK